MKNQILEDLTVAMKARDKETLSVLRMVKGAVQLDEINLKRELNDAEMLSVLVKQVKTRKESINEFEKGGRQDLIDKTQSEIDILSKYLPEQLSEEDVVAKVKEAYDEVKPSSMADMGKMMGKLSYLKGQADMGFISKTIKEMINNG